ncbi:ArsR/SmtB family transcription factor [Allorhizobium taibaishanense]|uniref:DNA-binding transcriptional ArsR family regulator n=1 Tax=Allorhizobium taibaishanense TaxID=887144 RepID=A0A1Q9AAM7_9HYPH|nr:helix-turn-helix transcriptional regulator [Allorhizobium taibaishanense]MBB4007073.1 DNA-binding transcriptional ArsR family regulator [Allorhizobium taibaishanense]OLP51870.1 transcriptional regulator [Allorhizobium taibaishanense]
MSNIASANTLAEIAALIGDPARANMLIALMAGQALTAGELARHSGITAQTASGHLAKMVDGRLLSVEKQGRHRYFRLAGPSTAAALESVMALAADGPPRRHRVGPKDLALRSARSCYDHIAGRLGVTLADRLQTMAHIAIGEGAVTVTSSGQRFFCDFGIDLSATSPRGRPLCRTCLDWSERRPHLAGHLGAALMERMLSLSWVSRQPQSRALRITRAGEAGLQEQFGFSSDWMA